MQLDYGFFFFESKSPSFNIRSKIISPSKPTTFSTSSKSCKYQEQNPILNFYDYLAEKKRKKEKKKKSTSIFRKITPIPGSVNLNIANELLILLGSPGTFFKAIFITAWSSPHLACKVVETKSV